MIPQTIRTEQEGSHPKMRLFLTSDPSPAIPIGLLARCIKLSNEPPAGAHAFLSVCRAYLLQIYRLISPVSLHHNNKRTNNRAEGQPEARVGQLPEAGQASKQGKTDNERTKRRVDQSTKHNSPPTAAGHRRGGLQDEEHPLRPLLLPCRHARAQDVRYACMRLSLPCLFFGGSCHSTSPVHAYIYMYI